MLLRARNRKPKLNRNSLGCAKSIALLTKVINLLLSVHPGSQRAISFFFLRRVYARKKEIAARGSASSRAQDVDGLVNILVFLSFSSLFFSPSRSNESGTMGRLDRWMGDDSVQRGVRNFHARASRRAGKAAPAAHTGETHESGSLLVATTGGV